MGGFTSSAEVRALPSPWGKTEKGMTALRLGLGLLWAVNLVYIFDPSNQFWSGFGSTAASYSSQTLGGGGLALFVADHPLLFAGLIAGVTLYLAVAFLLGLSARAACVVGALFNLALLMTQWTQISTFPGSTDVGAQPLYLAMYVALFLGYDSPRYTLDHLLTVPLSRWFRIRRPVNLPFADRTGESVRGS
ncbi:MAG: hypothetical protein L3K02_05015 [Thermoplasmata archaeon]|nr:hypothetical protein [Thermoplasmata archaeon]